MIKFCNFKGHICACDDNTIKLHNLKVIHQITEEEYEKAGCIYHIQDGQIILGKSDKEKAEQEIFDLKQKLAKYKEDVEQVELFGMDRTDYEEKKKTCAEIIVRLRELEKTIKTL